MLTRTCWPAPPSLLLPPHWLFCFKLCSHLHLQRAGHQQPGRPQRHLQPAGRAAHRQPGGWVGGLSGCLIDFLVGGPPGWQQLEATVPPEHCLAFNLVPSHPHPAAPFFFPAGAPGLPRLALPVGHRLHVYCGRRQRGGRGPLEPALPVCHAAQASCACGMPRHPVPLQCLPQSWPLDATLAQGPCCQ